jgi:uncharacterized membrane protein YphA (DoxX/SURF4 family)
MPESAPIAMLAMRLLAGILFFFQGYDKLFRLKTEGVLRAFSDPLAQRNIPPSFARACIFLSSSVELACGILLVTGLFRDPVIYLLTADLLCVALAFSFLKPMWEMGFFFPRFVLLMTLLLLPAEWDCYSISNLF